MIEREYFDIVDEDDTVIGKATRSECHGNPSLIHRTAHVLVFNTAGQLLLQKRSETKDIQPGKWDTSVGGHLDPGESYKEAALREMNEELGIKDLPLGFLYNSKMRNEVESENVQTFITTYDGPITFSADEIDEVRFWSTGEIDALLGTGTFTPNFEDEWSMYLSWNRKNSKD